MQNITQLLDVFGIDEMDIEGMEPSQTFVPYFAANREQISSYAAASPSRRQVNLEDLVRSRADPVERNAGVTVPKSAGCLPGAEVVSLNPTNNAKLIPFPSCTRVSRCGGCCQHELISCQPVETEIVNFKVHLIEYRLDGPPKVTPEIVPIEKHTKCSCTCIIKESDCTSLQKYEPDECRCVCTNKDDESKCKEETTQDGNPVDKQWDSETCSCKCRKPQECSSGSFFSESTCQCETISSYSVRAGAKVDDTDHDYNVYKLLTSYHERSKYRQPVHND